MTLPTSRKRLLFVSPVVPGEEGNGLAMRAGVFLDAYARHFDVDLAIIPVAAGNVAISAFVARRCASVIVIQPRTGSHFRLLSGLHDPRARCDAFRQFGHPSLTAGIAEPVVAELTSWIGAAGYAIVHVSRLYLAGLAGALRQHAAAARFVLDCDENDVTTQQSIARMHRRNGAADRAEWALAEADAFAALARRSLGEFDVAFVAARSDALSLARQTGFGRFVVVPNVVSTTAQRPARIEGSSIRTVLFVGTLGYEPNADAVGWFASRIWPRLSATMPGRLRLVVAGSGAPARIRRLSGQRGIAVTGFVRDLASLYRSADLAIAPLRAGGGTRIKLLEAAGHGVPSVATWLGAEGLDLHPGRDILLADGAERFAGACAMLLTDAALARRMAGNARRRVRSGYDRSRWAARVGDFALQLTAESYIPPSPVHGLGLTNV